MASNLADGRYKGYYYGSKWHEPDFDTVIERAKQYGVRKLLISASYLKDAKDSYNLSMRSEDLYCTAGIHPTRANEAFKDYD